jgi:hypothetical protein
MKQTLHLDGVGALPISTAEAVETPIRLTGRQGLALLRLLERHRKAMEAQADSERDQEYGRGPGYVAEIPKKIKKSDPRIGRQAVSLANNYQREIEGSITAILRYENGVEQFEIQREIYGMDSKLPGTQTAWVHEDDVDIL